MNKPENHQPVYYRCGFKDFQVAWVIHVPDQPSLIGFSSYKHGRLENAAIYPIDEVEWLPRKVQKGKKP